MAHILSPIIVVGIPKCCDASTKRTEESITGDVVVVSSEIWTVTTSDQGVLKGGTVTYGICCASEVSIDITIRSVGPDPADNSYVVTASVDGVVVINETGNDVSLDEFNALVELDDSPCGHIVRVVLACKDDTVSNETTVTLDTIID